METQSTQFGKKSSKGCAHLERENDGETVRHTGLADLDKGTREVCEEEASK